MNYRIVSHDVVLGVGDITFNLVKGEMVKVYEKDKYGVVRVRFHKSGSQTLCEFLTKYEEVSINGVMLDRITNDFVKSALRKGQTTTGICLNCSDKDCCPMLDENDEDMQELRIVHPVEFEDDEVSWCPMQNKIRDEE